MNDIHRARTLTDLIVARASSASGIEPALTFLRDGAVTGTVSAIDLVARAQGVAARLVAHGVRPGDRVLLMLTSQQDVVDAFFGAVWCGALPVPLFPPIVTANLDDFVARFFAIATSARSRLLLASGDIADHAAALAEAQGDRARGALQVLGTSSWYPTKERLDAPAARREADLCFLQYTSGSTGTPKGVALSHANVLHNVAAICTATRFGAGDVGVSWLPLYHDMGLIGGLLATLRSGARLVSLSPIEFAKRPAAWLRAISEQRGTLSPAPDFAYRRCLALDEQEVAGIDLSSWRIAFNGAEPIAARTLARFAERFGAHGLRSSALFPVYGLAEHTLAVTFPRFGAEPHWETIDRRMVAQHARAVPVALDHPHRLSIVSVGVPLQGVELEIQRDRVVVGDGEIGEICVKSNSVMQGYFEDAAATAEVLDGGWLKTGDLGYLRDGELFVTGRRKELIIIAGRNFYPHDLEAAAAEIVGVRAGRVVAFAVGSDDGEAAVVVAETEGTPLVDLAETVALAIGARVGVRPREVLLVPRGSLPVTSSGKIQRSATRDRFLSGALARCDTAQPP